MKYEKLNESNGKSRKMFLYGFLMCAVLLIIINMFLTKAKYKVVDNVKLVNSTINYSNADLNVIAMYKNDGEKDELIKEVPKGYYDIDNDKSYCKVPDSDNLIKDKITYDGNEVNIKITQKGTKCYVYFIPASTKTLNNFGIEKFNGNLKESVTGPSCANGTNNSSHNGESCTLQENGIYATEDDYGTSYIYRGTVNNNWVKFGKTKDDKDIWWRIIRINGNGTIRLIYSGVGTKEAVADTSGNWSKFDSSDSSVSQIGTQAYNASSSDNTYVGFKYGETGQSEYNKTHTNTNKSDIMKYLENWYNGTGSFESSGFNSLNYKDKIDESTGFCNDRELATGHGNFKGNGAGQSMSAYAPAGRMWGANNSSFDTSGQEPTLKCTNKTRDLFTMSGAENGDGNGALIVPVGLVTGDEVLLTGGFGGTANYGYWLYSGLSYWTMSSSDFDGSNARVFRVNSDGSFSAPYVTNTLGVRPVINLKSNLTFTGKGTSDSPFEISE